MSAPHSSQWYKPTKYNRPAAHLANSDGFLQYWPAFVGALALMSGRWFNVLFVAVTVMWFFFPMLRRSVLSGATTPRHLFEPESPNTDDSWLSDLEIFVNHVSVGRDRGVLGFDEELIYFAGAASSFAIVPQDIMLGHSFEKHWKSPVNVPPDAVLIRLSHPRLTVEISLRLVQSRMSRRQRQVFAEKLRNFALRTRKGSARSSYPPLVEPTIPRSSQEKPVLSWLRERMVQVRPNDLGA